MRFFYFVSLFLICSTSILLSAEIQTEEIKLPGLKEKVTVTYDNFGVPHIRAGNERDLYFAQGCAQARDRLWQMDLMRRRATARMAELFGEDAVASDIDMLNTQIPQVSKKIWEASDPAMKELLQAFSDGVNACVERMETLPEEYAEIGARPAPWSPVDSVAFGRLMSWALSSDLGMEIVLGEVVKVLGKKLFMDIAPFRGADPITITKWEESARSFPEELFQLGSSEDLNRPLYASGRTSRSFPGSNNWVVSGSRTESGFPILSNDPHLGLDNPPIWYEIHLAAPGLNVSGSTFPSTPGVIIGRNERIAWGVTTTGYDVTDVYVEKLDKDRPDTHYIFKGESLPFKEEKLEIRYKAADGGADGMKVREHTILHTIHGPVVREARPQSALSYRWTGHEPTFELRCFYEANRARNLDDFKKALTHFRVGAQSFVYADVDGNIFYKSPGNVPIRKGLAFLPLDGSSGEYEWTGYIPFDELPHAENPPAGFVATANNRPVDDSYPYYVGAFFDKGYRARRITDRIEAAEKKMTFAGMQSIQADVHSLPGERLSPLLFAAAEKHPELLTDAGRAALEILKQWDFETGVESIGSSIFHKWLKRCVTNIFSDDFPGDVLGHISNSEFVFPLLLRAEPLPVDWYDDKATPGKETKEMILVRSLNDAAGELAGQFGADMKEWKWGKLHKLTLGHHLGERFDIGPFEVDGAIDTVDNAGFGLGGGDFNFGGGPSLRMTVELRPGAVRGENVLPGGQEARIGSPHYADQMALWLRNEAHPMNFSEKDIEGAAERIVVFSPE